MERAALSVVTKFGVLLVDELQEIRGVGQKVVQLMDELATMNAILRMLSETDETNIHHVAREWRKKASEIYYDYEDCIDIYWIRIRQPIRLLQWPKHQFQKVLVGRRTLAADIRALMSRTKTVNEHRARYGINLDELCRSACFAPVSAASVSARALRRANDPDQFVGIREEASTLARAMSKNDDERDGKLKVFSIVGSGGLGKTTMAMEVCRELSADFQLQALVSVSKAFDGGKDMKGLLLRLLQQLLKVKEDDQHTTRERLTNGAILDMDVQMLSSMLKEVIKDKRYLIVIDDLWSLQAWGSICMRLPKNNHGSRVIVTTRIETVAKAASSSEGTVHQMKPLQPEASKKLFLKTVFGSMDKHTCPNELEDTVDMILNKCGGFPLAIVTIASLLASYNSADSREVWRRVSHSIGFQMENHPTLEGMRQHISLCFDYLPHHLKACMLYLSIFPEDYIIEKVRLLYRWIAEGLVAEKQGLNLLEVAEEYYNDLISRSMIIKQDMMLRQTYYGDNEEETCQMHDMMLEVMVSKSSEINFVCLVGRQYGEMSHGKVRHLSIHGDCDTVMKVEKRGVRHGIETMKFEHVRSLTIFQSEAGLSKLLDRLVEFKLLRVLDLQDCTTPQNKHMRYVCRLYLLRFLSLKGTKVSVMPSKMGELEHLESLDVEKTNIRELPQTITKLTKLQRLKSDCWKLPRGIGRMMALREVGGAVSPADISPVLEITELQQLQVLCIEMETGDELFWSALASSLENAYSFRVLHLDFNGDNEMDLMKHIYSPPPLLRSLSLSFPIAQLPDWIPSLTHLVELRVQVYNQSNQLLDALCNLPNLQNIIMQLHSYVDRELVARTTHNFPMLRILELRLSSQYPESIRFEVGSMAKLEKLELIQVGNLKRSINIVGIENLKNLKEVKLDSYIDGESVQLILEQVKTENENHTESN